MKLKTKNRQLIQYLLIACIVLIQITVFVFFYNEYFNAKKLSAIEEKIQEMRVLKKLTNNSQNQLIYAQTNLQKYIDNQDKQHLDSYFYALQKLSQNIDSIIIYENTTPTLKAIADTTNSNSLQLIKLEKLIDSAYNSSQKPITPKEPPKIQKIQIENQPSELDIEIYHVPDSTDKKKFFPRIKDAITGNVEVKRDTTIIIAKQNQIIDTTKINAELNNNISALNEHYLKEIKKYETYISKTDFHNRSLYQTYDNLLMMSNNLLKIFNDKFHDYNSDLEVEYYKQNSINNKIRRYAVLGLMLLTFFVSGVLAYYTQLTFQYEKELKTANHTINQNLKFKNRILGMLSHEIRAPLKIINIFIQRIKKKTNEPEIIDYLNSIEFSNNSLLIQANQILEYATNHEKKLELKLIEFDLKDEINSICKMFQPYIESRKNTFIIHNQIPQQILVWADNTKIHQIFINILGNANKFTENGEIKLHTYISNTDENQIKLHCSISDTGTGISESDLEKIFEPYFQGVISHEVVNLGAGLGLNLCKEIVQLFNGNISAQSSLGKGTTIAFEINLSLVK